MRAIFELLESGRPFVRSMELEDKLEPGELGALRADGILRPASELTTWPCDVATSLCFRRVHPAPAGSACAYEGVCKDNDGRRAAKCGPRGLTGEELACEELSVPDLGRALRTMFGAKGRGLTLPAKVWQTPELLGWIGPDDRELVLVSGFGYTLTTALGISRPRVVLVPTAHRVTPAQRKAHAPGARVELVVLEEDLVAAGGHVVRRGAAADPPKPPAPPKARPVEKRPKKALGVVTRATTIAGATKWTEVRIALIDDETVRIDVGRRVYRCTHIDLGMAHAKNREPTQAWKILVMVCQGRGSWRWQELGGFKVAKQAVSRLRARLRAIFGIEESPFYGYRALDAWRARFDARAEAAD
jgi:hypothetical protein